MIFILFNASMFTSMIGISQAIYQDVHLGLGRFQTETTPAILSTFLARTVYGRQLGTE